jgi:uncharacterized protein (DUF2252 family)
MIDCSPGAIVESHLAELPIAAISQLRLLASELMLLRLLDILQLVLLFDRLLDHHLLIGLFNALRMRISATLLRPSPLGIRTFSTFHRDVIQEMLAHSFNQDIDLDARMNKFKAMTTLDPIMKPFAFYRATAHLYWKDLGSSNQIQKFAANCWLSGDAHVANIGAFQNSKGHIAFDLNDFDETVFADYKFDLWRMAISVGLVVDSLDVGEVKDAVDTLTSSYLNTVIAPNRFAPKKSAVIDDFLAGLEKKASKARQNTIKKWTKSGKFNLELVDKDYGTLRLKTTTRNIEKEIHDKVAAQFKVTVNDVAVRLGAGIGSQGIMRYYVLVNSDTILDIKQQNNPSAYLSITSATTIEECGSNDNAARVAYGTKKLLRKDDEPKYLGHMSIGGVPFSVRELNISKESFDVTVLKGDEKQFTKVVAQWGNILAKAHLRSSNSFAEKMKTFRLDSADVAKDFQDLTMQIVNQYKGQVNSDFGTFEAKMTKYLK